MTTNKETTFMKWCTLAILAIFVGIITYAMTHLTRPHAVVHSEHKYHMVIPDSPHIAGAWLEVDYISHDTAYCNWYSRN